MNVKVGDLAVIISGPQFGLIVEVRWLAGLIDDSLGEGPHWGVYSQKPVLCYSPLRDASGLSHKFLIPDERLRPLKGERFNVETKNPPDAKKDKVH